MINYKEDIEQFKKDMDNFLIRRWLMSALKNYDPCETYIIYDNSKIEIFNKEMLDLKTEFNSIKDYYISRPIRVLCSQ